MSLFDGKDWEQISFADRLAIKISSEKSFLNFTRIFFELIQGEPLLVNWHHRYVANEIDSVVRGGEHSKSLAVCMPPGSTKSEFLSVHLPAYTNMLTSTGVIPKFRNLNLSSGKSLVERNSRRTKDIISSQEYQEFWPCSFNVNQAEEWNIVDGKGKVKGQTVSKPMGGQIIGSRGGFPGPFFSGALSLDDPDKAEDMFSAVKREKSHRILTNTVRSRRGDKSKNDSTPVFIIQQRLHKDDSIGYALNGGMGIKFQKIEIPALITEDYLATLPQDIAAQCWECIKDSDCREINGVKHWSYWPEMEHIDQLIELWGRDEYTFMSQYMQNPITMSGGLVDTAWLGRYEELPWLEWMAVYVDTNSGKITDKNDYTVFNLCGMGQDGNMYVLEVRRGKWLPDELLTEAVSLWNRWKSLAPDDQRLTLRYMNVEDKQAGQGLIATLQERQRDVIVNAIPRGNNQNKFVRHGNCQPQLKAGKVFVPMTHREDGSEVDSTRFYNGDKAFNTDWVLPFITELDAVTVGVLMDQESGYDDQYDTLMDAVDDMLINSNGWDGWL